MSKHDKNPAESEVTVDLAADTALSADQTQAAPQTEAPPQSEAAPQPEPTSTQTEQSRQFNSWLDRALPRLMQYLGEDTTSAVTSPGPKAKH
jgi:hypothetical protein